MRTMTTVAACVVFIAGAASTAAAQAADSAKAKPPTAPAAASIEGAWSGYLDMGGNGMAVNASFKKEKDGYTGTMSGPEGDVPLKDIELKGDTLTAVASVSMGGSSFDVYYWFVVTKDALSGSLDANVQGQAFSLPLTLKRPE